MKPNEAPSGGWSQGRSVKRRWHRPRLPLRPDPLSPPSLGAYAADHLARKVGLQEASPRWISCCRGHLQAAVGFFGSGTSLDAIRPSDVERFAEHLLGRDNGRGGRLSAGTVRQYLNSLSNLLRRARRDRLIEENPVQLLLHRPKSRRAEVLWLEPPEVARVLTVARSRTPARPDLATPFLFELLALFAYTGLRKMEGLGLEIRDLDLGRRVLSVRSNRWRGLKTGEAERTVPLFSDLAAILSAYLRGPMAPQGALLFPSPHGDTERPLRNLRRSLDSLPMPARLNRPPDRRHGPSPGPPPLRTGVLRHSFCAARLQTLDHGRPIAPFTVAREMGHTDLRMVLGIYGHLGTIRYRSEEVCFLRGDARP